RCALCGLRCPLPGSSRHAVDRQRLLLVGPRARREGITLALGPTSTTLYLLTSSLSDLSIVNLSTNTATFIASTGLSFTHPQGLEYDPVTDALYMGAGGITSTTQPRPASTGLIAPTRTTRSSVRPGSQGRSPSSPGRTTAGSTRCWPRSLPVAASIRSTSTPGWRR